MGVNNTTASLEELNEIKRIALAAGAILMRYYSSFTKVEWKAPGDPVTAADRDASEYIVREIETLFPQDGILSEEHPDNPERLNRARVWLIDPMDGTREFIEHREDFAVQIGLVIEGVARLGVVFQPTKDSLYYGGEGLGAFLDQSGQSRSLRVSPEAVASQMTMAQSRSHRSGRIDRIAATLRIPHAIRMGSVGLKVGLICEARAHLYIHPGSQTNIWDTCAPEAILREAGGRMTDAYGEALRYMDPVVRNTRGVIASNGVIHDRAVRVTQFEI